jgi:hypothetical protein
MDRKVGLFFLGMVVGVVSLLPNTFAQGPANDPKTVASVRDEFVRFMRENPISASKLAFTSDGLKSIDAMTMEAARMGRSGNHRGSVMLALEMVERARDTETSLRAIQFASSTIAAWSLTPGYGFQIKSRYLNFVIEQLNRLRRNSRPWLLGHTVQAERSILSGYAEEALEILESLAQLEEISAHSLVRIQKQLGIAYERTGRIDEALSQFLANREYARFDAAALDSALRAIFIQLELGRQSDAEGLLEDISPPDDGVLADSEYGAELVDLLRLLRANAHKAYWAYSATWFPDWLQVEAQVGLKPLKQNILTPALPHFDFHPHVRMQRPENPLEFFRKIRSLAHSARWRPRVLEAFISQLMRQEVYLPPDTRRANTTLAVKICGGIPKELVRERRRGLMTAAGYSLHYFRSSDRWKYIDIYDRENPEPAYDQLEFTMNRIRTQAVLGTRMHFDRTIEILKRSLSDADPASRVQTVALLATLWKRFEQPKKQMGFVSREIRNPIYESDPKSIRILKSLLPADE